EYVRAIRSVSPQGPYRIGGYSAGGIIAFEMAQQLLASGEKVAALVMLDAPAPRANRKAFTLASAGRLARNMAYWAIDDEFLRSGWAEQRARVRGKIAATWTRMRMGGGSSATEDVRARLGL